LDWWLKGFSSVNETQVPTSASTVTGSTPMSVATVMATGVTIEAVAALDHDRGARLAASCQRATNGFAATASALSEATKQVSPAISSV
jgi:hypothetical protein